MNRGPVVERVVLLGALALLLGVGVWLVTAGGSNEASAPDDTEADDTEADDTAPDDTAPDDTEADEVLIDEAGPLDGLESLRLPITATPATDLVDQQDVEIAGSGFTAGATIAMVQCWLGDGTGSRDDCDLGNIAIASADDQGAFISYMTVNQLIDTANGVRDCATGGTDAGCRIGVGNTLDLDESGAVEIVFRVADGIAPPSIEATPTSGLRDGDAISVSGVGFDPDSQVMVTQCPVGGLDDASWGCVNRNPGELVDVDAAGSFSMTVAAQRQRVSEDGAHDCALEVYRCMLVVRTVAPPPVAGDGDDQVVELLAAGRSPNPIPLDFDPAEPPSRPPEYTVSPSQDLVAGAVVRLDVFDMPVDGSFTVRQCADGGPRGLFCEPLGNVDVVDGTGGVDLVVVETLSLADDTIDCTEPARRCYLTLDGELADAVRGPLRFAS
ncbi:MAG: neocarzinostatin apoprotein domain-containing protein [Acidimicrobiales bacterium]